MHSDSKIDSLRQKKAQIEAEIGRLQAQQRVKARKEDTRRKILAGAVVLQEMSKKPAVEAWVRQALDEKLQKPRDRELFDLGPKS